METNQSHIEFEQDDTSNMSYETKEDETNNLDLLLEQIETIETESSNLKEKINHLQKMLEEQWSEFLQQLIGKNSRVQAEFKEPILMPSMELASKMFDEGITELTSLTKNLTQELEELTKKANKLMITITFRATGKD